MDDGRRSSWLLRRTADNGRFLFHTPSLQRIAHAEKIIGEVNHVSHSDHAVGIGIAGRKRIGRSSHPEEVIEMGYSPEEYRDKPLYKGTGCERCNDSGYRGRTAIHEIFILNSALRSMIIRSIPSSKLKKEAVKMGMRTLRMDGWEKILLGITTTEEVLRITQEE